LFRLFGQLPDRLFHEFEYEAAYAGACDEQWNNHKAANATWLAVDPCNFAHEAGSQRSDIAPNRDVDETQVKKSIQAPTPPGLAAGGSCFLRGPRFVAADAFEHVEGAPLFWV
jgi:hypothetical protein